MYCLVLLVLESTLLNIIGGIDSLDEGELIINKHRLKTMKEKELSQYRRDHLVIN